MSNSITVIVTVIHIIHDKKGNVNNANALRPSNPAGIRLYQRNGFEIVGERPGYYRSDEGRENALVMKLDLADP